MAFRIVTVPFDNERAVFPDNELNNFLLDKKVKNDTVWYYYCTWEHSTCNADNRDRSGHNQAERRGHTVTEKRGQTDRDSDERASP